MCLPTPQGPFLFSWLPFVLQMKLKKKTKPYISTLVFETESFTDQLV